jgi:hypothetical protein
MCQPHVQVALIGGIDPRQLIGAFIQLIQLPFRERRIHPGHPRSGHLAGSLAERPPSAPRTIAVRPHVRGNKRATECPASGCHRLSAAPRRCPRRSPPRPFRPAPSPAGISRTEAVLQVHRIAHSVDVEVGKAPPQHPLQHAQILVSRAAALVGVRWSRFGTICSSCGLACPNRFTCSRSTSCFGSSRDRSHQVPLLRPEVQHAAPIFRRERILGRRHLEQDPPVLDHRRSRMLGKKCLQRGSSSAAEVSLTRVGMTT